MRILGIDYGDTRIGLSISDPLGMIAGPLPLYIAQSMRKDADYIAALVKEWDAQKIVLGMPRNMDGSYGERADKTTAFGRVLEKITGLTVIFRDERLTTAQAHRALTEGGYSKVRQKEKVDTTAAQIILQSYLDMLQ